MTLLDAALDYARRHRPVFPVRIDKKPCTAHGFKDATTDEFTIRQWWERWPDAGIATPTGPGWFVLDEDQPGAITRLENGHAPLPPTIEVVTPRPGLHRYLRGNVTNSDRALPAGLNVRGQGGYVLLPPSPHRNGVYEWRTAPDEIPLANAPRWLLEMLTSKANGAGRGAHHTPSRQVPHGDRHPYLQDFCVRLLRAGITDRHRIATHLHVEFGLSCEPDPPPAAGYFEEFADWAIGSHIAAREQELADFRTRWGAHGT